MERFEALRCCVLIPTYNNAQTILQVIADVEQYCRDIIVVNDGSTDATAALLEGRPGIRLVSYAQNVGKGWALRQGFAAAAALGFDYALTIDSDGQHFAKDLPVFLDRLEANPGSLIIGSRNMDQASVPGKSSFGHKFSNFWFRVETGLNCPDTQSGYRLYPISRLKDTRFFTRKYEFEIEVLVRAAWKGIPVDSVPVSVYYAPKEVRISHFRPFTDFTRISILNTFLVLVTFLYIKPRDFVRFFFDREKVRKLVREQLLYPPHSDGVKALSIAFGLFMGIVPIWGFQLLVGISLAVLFRLNKALFILAAHISIPPMIPVLIFLSYRAGGWWIGDNHPDPLTFSSHLTLQSVQHNLQQYIWGSLTLATSAGLAGGLLSFIFLKLFKRKAVLIG